MGGSPASYALHFPNRLQSQDTFVSNGMGASVLPLFPLRPGPPAV